MHILDTKWCGQTQNHGALQELARGFVVSATKYNEVIVQAGWVAGC